MGVGWIGTFALGVASVTASAACGDSPLEGDGEVVTETRGVDEFSALRVSNGAVAFFTVDPSSTGEVNFAVTTDSNLLEFVTTEVSGETLRGSIDSDGVPMSTQGFETTGTVRTERDVEADDGGEATIEGSVATVTLNAATTGLINGDALEVGDVEVEADNGASITVCATGTGTNGADLIVLCGGNARSVETSSGATVTAS